MSAVSALGRADVLSRLNACRWCVPKSLDEILREYGPALGRLAESYPPRLGRARGSPPGDRVGALAGVADISGCASERTFVFRIAHNRALAHRARRRIVGTEPDEGIEDRGVDPERALAAQQEGERLFEAIKRLPLASAQVVTLSLEGRPLP